MDHSNRTVSPSSKLVSISPEETKGEKSIHQHSGKDVGISRGRGVKYVIIDPTVYENIHRDPVFAGMLQDLHNMLER